jgi:hypothetical protein
LSPRQRRRTPQSLGNVELLEGRRLLSFLQPFAAKIATIRSGGALDVIIVSGPGQAFTERMKRGLTAVSLVGTTQVTQVTISTLGTHPQRTNSPVQIGRLRVHTGRLGSFQALTTADLVGPMSPLMGPVSSLQFDAFGPAAQVEVNGNLGQLTVNQSVTLGPAGYIDVAGNLTSLSVGNDLQTSRDGSIRVGADLGTLSVGGAVSGDGSNDIVVGDDLGQITVLGGASGGSLQDVNINVAKNIQGLDIRNGLSHSLITAGILIDGGTPGAGSNGWNIGPDGTVAVFDSQILAGSEIRNVTIGGNVESDLPGIASGSPTRIVAGEYPQGNYMPGGTIDNFQITGQLINSVLAASVTPYNGFYPEPAGTIEVGFFPTPPSPRTTIPNFTAPPFAKASIPASEIVLPGGSINPSFIPPTTTPTPGAPVPLPSKSTVLGGVVTTTHINNADYAGIFAADTRGVIVGPLPPVLTAGG